MYETLNLLHAIEIKVLQGVKESMFDSYYCVLVKNNMRERERDRESSLVETRYVASLDFI